MIKIHELWQGSGVALKEKEIDAWVS